MPPRAMRRRATKPNKAVATVKKSVEKAIAKPKTMTTRKRMIKRSK